MRHNSNKNDDRYGLEVDPDIAWGEYANLALVSHSPGDFVIDFAKILPGMEKPTVCSRIIMTPEHFKRLAMAIQENIYKYEKEFGTIYLRENEPKTATPFGNHGDGEA